MTEHASVVIIGAGPAGLAAAYELVQRGLQPIVLEKSHTVGGIARTEVYKGYRFDIGGHRFYTKLEAIQDLWEEMLGADFLKVPRLSHIYYRGRLFNYPLDLPNTLSNLGLIESLLVVLSFLRAKVRPLAKEEYFDHWITNRFGQRMYEMFFRTYTEKVWGIPCHQIRANWAAQRIRDLSFTAAVSNALFGTGSADSLIKEFHYPVLGPGWMWQRFREAVEREGGQVWLDSEVVRLQRDGERIAGVIVKQGEQTHLVTGDHFISSMPLQELVAQLDPPPPAVVLRAARRLRYRDFILVGLIVNRARPFPDNWIYVHSPEVKVGRVQNFKNWSAAMVPDPTKASLGMEYFCSTGDAIWQMPDAELVELAARELESMGLAQAADVEDGIVFRQSKAYPVYDRDYQAHVAFVRGFLATLDNLQTIGRNGMHRYNNMDHSMLTGILAARNLMGEEHDLWSVNTEQSYYEQGLPGAEV